MPAASPCPGPRMRDGAAGRVPGTGADQDARRGQKGPWGAWILVWSCGALLLLLQAHSRLASQIGSKWLCAKKNSLAKGQVLP